MYITIKGALPEACSIKHYAQQIHFKGKKPTSYERIGDLYNVVFDCESITEKEVELLTELAVWCNDCLALGFSFGCCNLTFVSLAAAKEFLDNLPSELITC